MDTGSLTYILNTDTDKTGRVSIEESSLQVVIISFIYLFVCNKPWTLKTTDEYINCTPFSSAWKD